MAGVDQLNSAICPHSDALRLEPNSPEILTIRGLVLFLSGKLSQALQHVVSALKMDPGYEPALRLRKRVKDVERLKDEGNTAFKAGNLEEAVARYTETLEVGETSNSHLRMDIELFYTAYRRCSGGRERWSDTCYASVESGHGTAQGVCCVNCACAHLTMHLLVGVL